MFVFAVVSQLNLWFIGVKHTKILETLVAFAAGVLFQKKTFNVLLEFIAPKAYMKKIP